MPGKPRVLPPLSTTGLYLLAISLGFLLGILATWVCFWIDDAYGSIRGGIFLLVLVAFPLPAWLAGRIVARVHQHLVPNILFAICYAASCIVGALLVLLHLKTIDMLSVFGRAPTLPLFFGLLAILVVYTGITSAFIAAATFSGFLTECFLGRRVIIQPGLTCWVCGYNLGAPTITTCPECGVGFDPNHPPRSASYDFLGFLKRNRRWPLALALLIALAPLTYSATTQTIPAIRFLSARPAGAELRRVTNINYVWLPRTVTSSGNIATYARPLSRGWWIPDTLDPDAGFAVIFHPVAIEGQPRMFITRGCLNDSAAAIGSPQPRESWAVYPGTQNVVAKLTSAQANEVIRTHAVPSSLITALRAKAEEVHWAVQSGSSMWPTGEQKVDPAPYFQPTP